MQCDALLRQLAKPSRNQARPAERTPCHRFGRTRRTLALLLSGRCICRVLSEGVISFVLLRVISMKAGRVKVQVRLIVSPFYPSCRHGH